MCSAGVGAAVCDGSSSINRSASDTGVGCCCFLPCPTVSCDCLNLLWLVELWVQRIRVLLLGLWGSTALTEPGPSALCSSSSSLMAGHLDGAFVCTQINGAGEVPSASGGAVRLCPSSWEHSVRNGGRSLLSVWLGWGEHSQDAAPSDPQHSLLSVSPCCASDLHCACKGAAAGCCWSEG